jgi:hypothetical protein
MRSLPKYSVLTSNYPDKHQLPTKSLLDAIGGEVRKTLGDSVNTCAIRMSEALIRSGQPIQKTAGLYQLQGARTSPVPGRPSAALNRYIVRVPDLKKYLEKHYGMGKLIYDADKRPTELVNLPRQTQGIIVFVWSGVFREFGASGHVDLFRLWPNGDQPPRLEAACEGQCYWWTQGGPMKAYLWETTP